MPHARYCARSEYVSGDRLPKVVFFELDMVSKPSKYPHMLPSHLVIRKAAGDLGILPADTRVLSTCVARTFTLNGHKNVYFLDHFELFKKEFAVERGGVTVPVPVQYDGIGQEQFFRNYRDQVIEFEKLLDSIENNTLTEHFYHFNARSAGRFAGTDPEPRPELSLGLVARDEPVRLFKDNFGLDLEAPLDKGIIFSCGSGVTVVVLRTAIKSIDEAIPLRVYNESWPEWALRAPEHIAKH
ncbi:hypothetical protein METBISCDRAFT_31126 [Metschnikowia bicuspidata]|uniref:Rhodanese domain-containing protein n=1 Tax=Metschnikowia bicuspidata TaxID=27322 RepID=A0A4P9ZBB9_9ASCO|nr:hypothetical protein METBISCDRAFT_31126 [Metschnikowia bicuspidata]